MANTRYPDECPVVPGNTSYCASVNVTSTAPPGQPLPELVLSGKLYVPEHRLDVLPLVWPNGTLGHLLPIGGTPPYSYSSGNDQVATVDAQGVIAARGNGITQITVRDSAQGTSVYSVRVTGVITCHGLGINRYVDAVELARSRGLRLPDLVELNIIYSTYEERWPQGDDYYWSSDPYSSIQHWVKNLVTGVEGYGRSTLLPPWTYCLTTAL